MIEDEASITDYSEFFNITALKGAVPVITTAEFIEREKVTSAAINLCNVTILMFPQVRLGIPEEFQSGHPFNFEMRKKYNEWQLAQNW